MAVAICVRLPITCFGCGKDRAGFLILANFVWLGALWHSGLEKNIGGEVDLSSILMYCCHSSSIRKRSVINCGRLMMYSTFMLSVAKNLLIPGSQT